MGKWLIGGLLVACILAAWLLMPSLAAPAEVRIVPACGGSVGIRISGEPATITRDDLLNWVSRAGSAVCAYYGRYPVSRVNLDIHVRGGAGVHGGMTYPDHDGRITISVGPNTTKEQLDSDWMLTHEMIHLAFPSMADEHHWIEEGISVYAEPIARVKAGQLSAAKMWGDVIRDMPQGEPGSGDEGLDRTHSWGRTYWGGALFCLIADVRIREATHNRKGLQDALRGILNAGGDINQDWTIQHAFAEGDKATGTSVLTDLYREMGEKPMPVDLPSLWHELGVQRGANGMVQFIESAPLAGVRNAITSGS